MTEIEFSITRLASLGRSPYKIEETLGIPHYTIHQKYHAALMSGYAARERLHASKSKELTTAPAEPIERQETKTKEEIRKREKLAERQRRYQQANKEKIAEYKRKYNMANKEKFAEYMRKYRQANREKIAEINHKYYQANKEKFAEYMRQYNARKRQEKQSSGQIGR